jgi:hypothetical protein
MKKAVKYKYRTSKGHLVVTAYGLIMTGAVVYSTLSMSDRALAWVKVASACAVAIYAILMLIRTRLLEGAVYLATTYISVPLANRAALPSIFGGTQNIRIPYATINDVTSTNESSFLAVLSHEYLHIHYGNKETTIDSAMFESEVQFEQFKSKLYSRLNIKQTA